MLEDHKTIGHNSATPTIFTITTHATLMQLADRLSVNFYSAHLAFHPRCSPTTATALAMSQLLDDRKFSVRCVSRLNSINI